MQNSIKNESLIFYNFFAYKFDKKYVLSTYFEASRTTNHWLNFNFPEVLWLNDDTNQNYVLVIFIKLICYIVALQKDQFLKVRPSCKFQSFEPQDFLAEKKEPIHCIRERNLGFAFLANIDKNLLPHAFRN